MKSEAVTIARETRRSATNQAVLKLASDLLSNPIVGLVVGIAVTESLFQAGFFGSDEPVLVTEKKPFSIWDSPYETIFGKKTVTVDKNTALKTKNNIETAIYVVSVARGLAPILPQIVSLGESAMGAVGNLAKPAVPLLTAALGGV